MSFNATMNADLARICVAGSQGMVGSAVLRKLGAAGFSDFWGISRQDVDMTQQKEVRSYLEQHAPTCLIIAAAKVGGIYANKTQPAEFLYENIMIAANLIHAAYQAGVKRVLFLGSTCIYPRLAEQPIREESLLTSPLEETNEAYAIAKIAGLKLCQFYRQQYGCLFHSAMPTNLYGTGDNYHVENSHVLPALIRKFDDAAKSGAETVPLWGTGTPLREFLHVDDLAAAIVHLIQQDNPPDWVNVGSGEEVSIRELAQLVQEAVGTTAQPVFDSTMPDGTPRKFCDTTRIRLTGWSPLISLKEGIMRTVNEYREEQFSRARL